MSYTISFTNGDSVEHHAPRGSQWPPDQALPSYPIGVRNPLGAPPAIARHLHKRNPPPAKSYTSLDQDGWTPSSWATQADPSPVSIVVGGARHAHALESDGLYSFKRLAHVPVSPFEATAENDWGLNPYDSNTPMLREFHAWAAEQGRLVQMRGFESSGALRGDRLPGLSTLMQRSLPSVAGTPILARQLTPTQLAEARNTQSTTSAEATSATIQQTLRGFPLVPKSLFGLEAGAGAKTRVGMRAGTGQTGLHYSRADILRPTQTSVVPTHVFH